MAKQKPQQRDIKVLRVLRVTETPNGNAFLECRTDVGVAAFWESRRSMRNIQALGQRKPPFSIRCGCIEPTKSKFPGHDIWIPETSVLEFIESRSGT